MVSRAIPTATSREQPKQKPRSSQVEVPGQRCFSQSRPPIDSRRSNQVGRRQVFWLPVSFNNSPTSRSRSGILTRMRLLIPNCRQKPPAAPSHPRYTRRKWHFAAVVTGYSGASAADFHGLPFWPAFQAGNLQQETIKTKIADLSSTTSVKKKKNNHKGHKEHKEKKKLFNSFVLCVLCVLCG